MSTYSDASIIIPTAPIYKAGTIYALKPTNGAADLDVVRASTATRINKDRLIEEMAANVPRLDYTDGTCPSLLLEPQSTNLITYSEDFSNASWNKVNGAGDTLPIVASNYAISPDGTQNADRIQVSRTSAAGSYSSIYKSITTASLNRALSIWLKSLNGSPTILITNNNGVYVSQQITTEWVRYELDLGVGTLTELQLSVVGSSFISGVSESADFLAWGYQLEALSYSTTYISTEGSTTTRLKDEVSKTGLSADINSEEGVFMVNISSFTNDSSFRFFGLSDGTTSNRINLAYVNGNTIELGVTVGGVNQSNINFTLSDISLFHKAAIRYKLNNISLWIDGVKVNEDLTSLVFTENTLTKLSFNSAVSGAPFYGNLNELVVSKEFLTDTEMATLTS